MSCVMMLKKARRRIMLQSYNDKITQQKRAQTTNRLTCTNDPLLTCTDEPRTVSCRFDLGLLQGVIQGLIQFFLLQGFFSWNSYPDCQTFMWVSLGLLQVSFRVSLGFHLRFLQGFFRVSFRGSLVFHLGFRFFRVSVWVPFRVSFRVFQGVAWGFFKISFSVSFKVSLGFHLWFVQVNLWFLQGSFSVSCRGFLAGNSVGFLWISPRAFKVSCRSQTGENKTK